MHEHVHGTPAEWFATGITLHEFVTGRRPFEIQKLQAFRVTSCECASVDLSLDHLDSCNFLSDVCKDFIRKLLAPEVDLNNLIAMKCFHDDCFTESLQTGQHDGHCRYQSSRLAERRRLDENEFQKTFTTARRHTHYALRGQ